MPPGSSPIERERRIHRVAARQQGQVSRAQLLALGLGAEAIKHRLKTGRLIAIRRGVYSMGLAPLSGNVAGPLRCWPAATARS